MNNSTPQGFPQGCNTKESTCNTADTGDPDLVPGSGRSPGGGNSNLLQYSSGKIPWAKERAGYGTWGRKESDITEVTIYIYIYVYMYRCVCIYTHIHTY